MSAPDLLARRVAASMGRIRGLAAVAVGRAELADMLDVLLALAADIPVADFPMTGTARRHVLHAEPDGRLALQINALPPHWRMPPHSHGTWAVLTVIAGVERQCLYHLQGSGLELTSEIELRRGLGLTMLPDDIHSVAPDPEPVLSLQLYGLALERQPGRRVYSEPGADG